MKVLVLTVILAVVFCQANESHLGEPEVEISPDDSNFTLPQVDAEIQKEIDQTSLVMLNLNHSEHYGFLLNSTHQQDFVIAVDVERDIEAKFIVYWKEGDTYVVSRKEDGQDVRVLVYEDKNSLVGNWIFYHAVGVKFTAKLNHEYTMKVFSHGKNKMIVLDVEHYVAKGSTGHAATAEHLRPHEQTLAGLKQTLMSYMTVAQTNHIINEWLAQNVRLHMHRFIFYEIFESVLIFTFAVAQGYFIRRLLTKGYSVV